MPTPPLNPAAPAPGEVYRDPVYDGATDPTVVRAPEGWWMFYTQRRATHPAPGPGVAWVHGSRIGVARSGDGDRWEYEGTLAPGDGSALALTPGPPPLEVDRTHWAPEVMHDGTRWRMYLTEIEGVPDRWEGHARHIVEYTSDDLRTWRRVGPATLDSDRVIDAAVRRCPDGRWRLWYKDEAAGSITKVAVSDDLTGWSAGGTAIEGRPHEGPFVIDLGGWWWMLTDEWRGLAVHRSTDAVAWERQDGLLLDEVGPPESGLQIGRHAMVVVDGEDAAWIYFFSHPWWDGSEIADASDDLHRRSSVQRARLHVVDDVLVCVR